jgi:Galactose oxidase, central domain
MRMCRLPEIFAMALLLCSTAWGGETGKWTPASNEGVGSRTEHFLFYSPLLKKAVLLGGRRAKGTACAMTFDPAAGSWSVLSAARPKLGKRQMVSSGDAGAVDPQGRRAWFLVGKKLYCFDIEKQTWTDLGSDPLLATLTARKMAFDPVKKTLIVVGSERDLAAAGWMGALSYDAGTRKWSRLVFGTAGERRAHAERRTALAALAAVVGNIRHAWYRDPKGAGTEAERNAVSARLAALTKLPGMGKLAGAADGVGKLVGAKRLLEALRAARTLYRRLEEATEAASPVPPARRNSPLVMDSRNKVMVLFGGDHDDYTTNDTWVLDLAKRRWRRAQPKLAPGPRAGHGLVYLPECGKIALFDGYRHNSTRGYRAHQAGLLPQRELWLYDVEADEWKLATSWPLTDKTLPRRAGVRGLGFFGYGSDYRAMAIAADGKDKLIFVGASGKLHSKQGRYGKNYHNATWVLAVDAGKVDAAGTAKLGVKPNTRFGRKSISLAAYCEDPAPARPAGLDALKPNVWTLLARPPRVPYNSQRRCPYGTAAWNPDGDELLHWGGGHCATSTSVVSHWSPASNRMVSAYDHDEPYGSNGGGPGAYSLMGRPWVDTHAYQAYGYDPKNKVMLLLKGRSTFLYDPARMAWLPRKVKNPFDGHCYTGHIIPTPHGAVAWAGTTGYMGRSGRGLWLFDGQAWKNIAKPGTAPVANVDSSASCYDSGRDRVLLFPNRGKAVGPIKSYSFKTGKLETVTPENPELVPKLRGAEVVYVEHCNWMVVLYTQKDKAGRACHPVYDCKANKWRLLYAGSLSVGKGRTQGVEGRGRGMVYDARRKLVYVMTEQGDAYALKVDPKTADSPGD